MQVWACTLPWGFLVVGGPLGCSCPSGNRTWWLHPPTTVLASPRTWGTVAPTHTCPAKAQAEELWSVGARGGVGAPHTLHPCQVYTPQQRAIHGHVRPLWYPCLAHPSKEQHAGTSGPCGPAQVGSHTTPIPSTWPCQRSAGGPPPCPHPYLELTLLGRLEHRQVVGPAGLLGFLMLLSQRLPEHWERTRPERHRQVAKGEEG